jgi:hypothetical protein
MDDLRDFRWFSGMEGDSAFWKPFLSIEEIEASNAELPDFFRRMEESGDDRSYVILTALILEYQYDSFLEILIPGFKNLRDNKDFSFSVKIELLRALRLIPPLIPRCADCIRQIRNEFAHNLEIEGIDGVKVDLIARAKALYNEVYEPYKQTHDSKTLREIFHGLAHWAIMGLRAYRPNVQALRLLINNSEFSTNLQKAVDGAFFEALKSK